MIGLLLRNGPQLSETPLPDGMEVKERIANIGIPLDFFCLQFGFFSDLLSLIFFGVLRSLQTSLL